MARWDLSKLPEGRKPLTDEWFAERAQMQERIAELEANLAKAVKLIELAIELGRWELNPSFRDELIDFTAELTGGKDE